MFWLCHTFEVMSCKTTNYRLQTEHISIVRLFALEQFIFLKYVMNPFLNTPKQLQNVKLWQERTISSLPCDKQNQSSNLVVLKCECSTLLINSIFKCTIVEFISWFVVYLNCILLMKFSNVINNKLLERHSELINKTRECNV